MRIHFIRNATLIIHSGEHRILVDPMLGPKGSGPSFSFIRHKSQRNPIVDLPEKAEEALETVTCGLVTHRHFDHLDPAGVQLLAEQQLPVYCNDWDESHLQEKGLSTIVVPLNQTHDFLGGKITAFETQHGYGLIGKLMGKGVGYLIELPNEPSLYISGDTVLTPVVRNVLAENQPDIAVLAAGSAGLDIGKPILMPMKEMVEFVELAPGKVIATHLEALNHCPVKRTEFRGAMIEAGVLEKVFIPDDGNILTFTHSDLTPVL
jgi:L-ascorbate metabolism protein UlaG (beta-lactamase superfamily)